MTITASRRQRTERHLSMSGSATSLAAAGDAALMLTLWVVVVARLGPPAVRWALALLSFGSAWTLCFLLSTLHAAAWMTFSSAAAMLTSIILLGAAAQTCFPRDGGGGGGEDGDGGLGRRPPDRPLDGGGPSGPSWWPEFERDLARYTAERERPRREPVVS